MKFKNYLTEKRRTKDNIDMEWDLTSDGWNEKEIDETGLMEQIEEVEKLAYELRNCRRGSYAKFGKTIKDLSSHISDIAYGFKAVGKDLKGRV